MTRIYSSLEKNPHWCSLARLGKFDYDRAVEANQDWISIFKNYKFNPKTAIEAIDAKAPSLASHKKYLGEALNISLIAQMIIWVLRMLNIQRKPDDGQVLMMSVMVFNEFYFLKISEIKLCFYNGLAGKYSELYAKFDVMDLMKWLSAYAETRAAVLARKRMNENKEQKKEIKVNPELAAKLRKKMEEITAKRLEKDKQQKEELKLHQIEFQIEKQTKIIKSCTQIIQKGFGDYRSLETDSDEKKTETKRFVENEISAAKESLVKAKVALEELKKRKSNFIKT